MRGAKGGNVRGSSLVFLVSISLYINSPIIRSALRSGLED